MDRHGDENTEMQKGEKEKGTVKKVWANGLKPPPPTEIAGYVSAPFRLPSPGPQMATTAAANDLIAYTAWYYGRRSL